MIKFKKISGMILSTVLAFTMISCGANKSQANFAGSSQDDIPKINEIKLGEDYKDLKADITILTNRTDIVDTIYADYAKQFMEKYPNIKVTYQGITDYEQTMQLRLPTGDWGDICFIPTSLDKSEIQNYFVSLGDSDTLGKIYNFGTTSQYEGNQYGIANGGTASGIVYNKKVWEKAGIKEMPKTPDEFLNDLQKIKDNTDAIPMYSNFAAGWPMGAWDAYVGGTATGDPDYMNNTICHTKNPFANRGDNTGAYAVYNTLYQAVERKLIEDDPTGTDWESSKGMINRGEIGCMVLGSWAVNQAKDAGSNPDDVAYMPFPITVNGKQYASTGGNYSFGINVNSSKDNKIASMLYVKWLVEESPIYDYEGSIPALKSKELPAVLADFKDVELISDNPAEKGEETLFNDINNESEVGLNKDDYPDCEILESALNKTKTIDDLMGQWNSKWSSAQEKLKVEVNK
ncbi:MAG: raffinose/stachyose/melibiose transport system substrate-binding protein [Clostridium butyricum]|uniref:ABC transporter substrate-binding protein n=1 Tax=Clostridium butyricum TaxID=1492 RepID=UPI0028FD5227|nr:ABC transporter substrate-binding protein [Clostridium butyricum]MDK2827452.1 raffinose/stachyose/melibiose transport system substrate-binding protein [Clostridium butyricum]MDU0323455.1 ABC transporter substrate-binding protein [Clostridium butyricum]